MSDRIFNVLFLCTGNSARSILAESILNKDGAGHFRAFSAGSQPKGNVNPLAIETLQKMGYPVEGLRSKSWGEFEQPNTPKMDFVITVCDNAAGEVCPIWPGHPIKAHWGIEDPAAAKGTHIEKLAAFATAFRYLKNRISLFAALPIAKLEVPMLADKVKDIGRSEGVSTDAG
jgi:arsenate reductase